MTTKFVNPNNPYNKQAQTPAAKKAAPAPAPRIQKFASKSQEHLFESDGNGGVFNPRTAQDSKERIYNSQGEMNAYSNKDALHKTAQVLEHTSKPLPGMSRQASAEHKERLRKIIAAASRDPTGEGFALIGQELQLPIKALIDYEAFTRKRFEMRNLEPSETWKIAKDILADANPTAQDAQGKESLMNTTWIYPKETSITSYPVIAIETLYEFNYDAIDRMQSTAKQQIMREEDKLGMRELINAAPVSNAVSNFTQVSLSVFENLRFQVERHSLIVQDFLINRQELSSMEIYMSGSVDPVTQREWNLAGYVGRLLGADIMTASGIGSHEVIPAGNIFAVTAPEYLGQMGVRIELLSVPFNGTVQQKMTKGFGFLEKVGFCVVEPHSVALATLI